MTATERRALWWLVAVCVTGAGVRLVRESEWRGAAGGAAGEALARQLLAVDSAQRASRGSGRSGGAGGVGGTRRRRVGAGRSGRRARTPDDSAGSRDAAAPERPTLTSVDLDTADSAALERLPKIGPALAARIVADRRQHGAFGTLTALQRVRGIGPKLAASLAPLVTFSANGRLPRTWR